MIQLQDAPETTSVTFIASTLGLVRRFVATDASTIATAAAATDASTIAAAAAAAGSTSSKWTYRFPYTLAALGVRSIDRAKLSPSTVALLPELLALCSDASIGKAFRRDSELAKLSNLELAPIVDVMTDVKSFRRANGIKQLVPNASY